MSAAFAFQIAAMAANLTKEVASFHFTVTVSRNAFDGTPRRASARRSARISLIALVDSL
jgi:hypothetical protein